MPAMAAFRLRPAYAAARRAADEGLAWGDSAGALHATPAAQIAGVHTQNEVRRAGGRPRRHGGRERARAHGRRGWCARERAARDGARARAHGRRGTE